MRIVAVQRSARAGEVLRAPGGDSSALVAGELDGPHTEAAIFLDSPFENNGTVCTKSITGTCFMPQRPHQAAPSAR